MDGEPFIADVRVNGTDFVPSLVDYGCLCYGAVSKRTFHSLQLPHIRVQPRILENAAGDGKEVKIDKITYVSIDLDGHQQHRVFMYVIDDLNWDMILGKRWMEDQDVHIHAKEGYLEIGSNGVQYHKWSRAFSQQLADQLPPHRPGVDLKIEVLKDEHGREKPLPWGPLYSMSREELLVLRKTLTELLDKGFIRVSSSPAAAPVLMRDRYPLPLLSETLRTIAKARWFTKVDVIAAFHKIRVAPGDEEKTTFRTRYGSFEWLVVPFGLTGAPAAFQRYINSALQDYLDDFVSAYIDDVLIFSSGSLQDHRDKVGKVLQRLMDAGLQLDINKTEPLTRLTKKDVPFRWDELCEEAFEKLKDLLITAPILAHFHPERETIVEADASRIRKHSAAEANYAIHDKELLAILRCLEQWEPELRAVEHFKILTDHKNLRYFYSERRLTERQVRWSEFLSRFQFELEWRPGRKGGLPDALSRRDQDMPANYSDERLKGRIMRLFQNDHLRRVPISTLSTNTEGAQEINFGKEIRIFEDEELQQLWHAARERVWIPGSEPLRTKIIQETHDSHITGHPGRDLTYSTLSRRFFWPGAASDVRRDTKKGLLKPLPIPQRIWSEITIDFITDLPPSGKDGATNCMVVTDRLTKGVELEGLNDISTEAVARRLFERHYPVHGIPTAITSDQGPQFVSGELVRLASNRDGDY
ncbi:reverse transcriptase (RNA-dependent DNA polymerase) [Hirsutella rhossiliensis]|uniref:RNA-directed DNA polymerase n=1 Tax=Hirsutella rhossiliensis TaxID=111463 RepID=A0A9P8SHA6_9HYPO|nr:reverse transcriptase (RNA-dependent DNA polymerase) domain-containing protein [Hirsutella rhossiliensis]KAH0960816.1 reverse transcriptase (RNA-dependent DNA polymerase) domain-containing protein [Hirsutella rhossiliensis]